MKQFYQSCALCAILLTTLLLSGCGQAAGNNVVETTAPDFTATPESPTWSDLEAVLRVPTTLPDGDSVELEFTLINQSETGLYVLQWYTPLEGLGGEIFRVERNGQPIPYEGPLAMRGDPTPDAYVFLDAGASVSATVDLAPAYDFSEPGEYTITFISPRISHVARTEGEMAASVDDLGPVPMPSNRVSLKIGSSSDPSVRRTPAEAAEMIRDYLQSQKPNLNPDLRLPLEELPMHEAWEHLQAQLFRVTEGPFVNESFLIRGDIVLSMGTAVGGRGLTSLKIGDLDRDGSAELLFTYGFGSGIHQSRIGMYAPAHGEDRTYEAGTGYLGDLGLFQEDMSTVGVRVVEADDATLTLRYLDTLGYLAIVRHNGQVELVLQVAEGLPDDVRQKVFEVTHEEPTIPGPTETYTSPDIGSAIVGTLRPTSSATPTIYTNRPNDDSDQ